MTAGENIRGTIWRILEGQDDYVGGATITGTPIYHDVLLRLEEQPAQQLLLQQGLETVKIFEAIIVPGTLRIKERDELEVTLPFDHIYYGHRFRIMNVRYSSFNTRDPRNYISLTMTRSERAHTRQ